MLLLVSIKSSSKNESKSQQGYRIVVEVVGWYQSKVVQRTKANHNRHGVFFYKYFVGINQK